MIETITASTISFISQFGYLAVFVLMLLESALIPIPSEVTMPFAGFLVGLGRLNFWWVVFLGAIGNLVGSWLAYGLGFWGEEKLVRSLIRKYGRWLLITEEEFDKAEKWFCNHGGKIAFFSRLIPVVRTFISLPAGIAKMSLFSFSFYTFVGSFIWSGLLTYIGLALGQNWSVLEVYFRKFNLVIVALFVSVGGFYIYKRVKRTRKGNI